MRTFVRVVLLTLIYIETALAQTSDEYARCAKKASTQLAMQMCANEELLRVDVELNDTYRSLLSESGSESGASEKVRVMERAWIAYRDAYIEAMYPAKDKQGVYGSVFPMEIDLLRAKLTRQQILVLNDLLKRYRTSTH